MDRREFLRTAGLGALGIGSALCGACDGAAEPSRHLAMVIDPAACGARAGCRACIDACHSAHNVPPPGDPARAIKWLWHERFAAVFPEEVHELTPLEVRQRPVLVLCNHCGSPPCVKVCPTGATWRRDDGIIMMDQHRCIGCRYCMAACPYGARSFNFGDPRLALASVDPTYPTREAGVVEKCTFCEERLRRGRPPACVEAAAQRGCGGLVFGDLRDGRSDVAALLRRRTAVRRKPHLGTAPSVFYLV